MRVALIDVDGHNFPNLPLMKLSAWHKRKGDSVEWYDPLTAWITPQISIYEQGIHLYLRLSASCERYGNHTRRTDIHTRLAGSVAEEIEHIYPTMTYTRSVQGHGVWIPYPRLSTRM